MEIQGRASFVATASSCLGLATGLLCIVFHETNGLENWTFEAQRRQAVREGRMFAPNVALSAGSQARWVPWSTEGASGRVHIVDFIYTRCPGLCEGLGTQFRWMQRELQQDGHPPVSLLSISFDLAGDTPERLAAYAQRHGAVPEFWKVARPTDPSAASNLLQTLGVVAVEDGMGGFVHNSALHVIDERGQVRGVYDYGNWQAALARARKVAREQRVEALGSSIGEQ